jgi:hypothetical protein
MPKRTKFDVLVRMSEDKLYIDVPTLSLYTWAPTFRDAEPEAREAIAVFLDIEEHSFDMDIEFRANVEELD